MQPRPTSSNNAKSCARIGKPRPLGQSPSPHQRRTTAIQILITSHSLFSWQPDYMHSFVYARSRSILHKCYKSLPGRMTPDIDEHNHGNLPHANFDTRGDAWRAASKQFQSDAVMKAQAPKGVRAMSPAQKMRAAEQLYRASLP